TSIWALAGSHTAVCSFRGDGGRVGLSRTQLLPAAWYANRLGFRLPKLDAPPNTSIRAVAGSQTAVWRYRRGGSSPGGLRCVQLLAAGRYARRAFRLPLRLSPPKTSIWVLAESHTAVWPVRPGGGPPVGLSCTQLLLAGRYAHRSLPELPL